MPDFAYLNARIRAMWSRLLSPESMVRLAAAPDMERFLAVLGPTPYGQWLAACSGPPYECLTQALRQQSLATLSHLRWICRKQECTFAEAAFAGFDTANIAAVVRGVAAQAPVKQSLEAALPFGPLGAEALAAAAAAPDVATAVGLLARGRGSAAATALTLLQKRPDASPLEIEAALGRWRLRLVTEWVEQGDDRAALRQAAMVDVDVGNILLALRLSAEPATRDALMARLQPVGLASLFAVPGRVGLAELVRAASEPSPAAAIGVFGGAYGVVLRGATEVTVAERALRRYRRQRLAALAAGDALGPGLLVGYLAALEWELVRLRHLGSLLARGRSAVAALELAA